MTAYYGIIKQARWMIQYGRKGLLRWRQHGIAQASLRGGLGMSAAGRAPPPLPVTAALLHLLNANDSTVREAHVRWYHVTVLVRESSERKTRTCLGHDGPARGSVLIAGGRKASHPWKSHSSMDGIGMGCSLPG